MPFARSCAVVLLISSAVSLHAQSSVPTLVQPLPAQRLAAGAAGATIDLRQHFVLPGVTGTEFAQVDTVVGRFNFELFRNETPRTVENFLNYVSTGRYRNTFIHRAVTGFVIQGGGYTATVPYAHIPTFPPVQNEFRFANVRGTVAMAKLGGDPNSATSEWFVNLGDNRANLDNQNGGFTVFARVLGTGMSVVDAIAGLPRYKIGFDDAAATTPASTPLRNVPANETQLRPEYYVTVSEVRPISLYPSGPSGSIVTFSIENPAPGVVQATLEGSTLAVSPVGAGTANLTVRATDTNGNTATGSFAVEVAGSIALGGRLSNLSVRAAMAAEQTLFMGFSVLGGAKPVLLRAVGPTLGQTPFNVAGAMANPRLALFRDATQLETSDNWGGSSALSTAFASVGAFALPPASLDAALLRAVDGGHTAQVTGTGAGIVLVEAYDAGEGDSPRFVNVSARNRVGGGDDILIAGFTVAGPGGMRLLIRAVGPRLGQAPFNVGGALADPKLEIYNSQGVKVTENDNWSAGLAATFQSVGAFPLDAGSLDAALLTVLPPGSYTAQVSGVGGGTGEGLVEIYEVR